MKLLKYITIVSFALSLFACSEEDLNEQSVTDISDETVIQNRENAEAAVYGCYAYMVGSVSGDATQDLYSNWVITMPGVLSDELTHSGSFPSVNEMDINNVFSNNASSDDVWRGALTGIYTANTVIGLLSSGGENLPGMSVALNNQFIAEARFVRAALHFELYRLWGAIPLIQTTDLATLSTIARSTDAEVISFITSELAEVATALASVDMPDAPFRASQWAAKALSARVNLFAGNLSQAGALADDVIRNGGFAIEPNYANVFSSTSSNEAIMRFYASPNASVNLAFWLSPSAIGGRYEFAISFELLNAYESGDTRALVAPAQGDPLGRYYSTKYTDPATGTDSPIFIRLAEMYLIRAEANLGSPQAAADLNVLRARAGIDPLAAVNSIDQILQERFVELAVEGHRWFDLKRTGKVNEVMSIINPTSWQATDALLPIPQNELDLNPNMTQNPGY